MNEPIRVLQIVTKMNRAGLESLLMGIYRNIDRTKVQFDFYTCRKEAGFFDSEIKELGGKVYYNNSLDMKRIYKIPGQFKTFFNEHKEYKIAHCHLNQWCGLVLKGAKQANVPVRIAHSHTSLETVTIKNIVKNVVKLPTSLYATHRWAVSYKAGEWLFGERMIEKGKVEIWPNAIDSKKFIYDPKKREEMRRELDLGNDLALIHVGNLRPVKNHAFLLKIFEKVLIERPSAKLLLIGKDGMNGEIQSIAKRMGIDQSVKFLGLRSDVPDLLQAGDVFIFPSLYEGLPGAVLEAQAAGLPCVISDAITDEVCITDSIKRLPLISTNQWVKQILKVEDNQRIDTRDQICMKGYDVADLARRFLEFYETQQNGILLYDKNH